MKEFKRKINFLVFIALGFPSWADEPPYNVDSALTPHPVQYSEFQKEGVLYRSYDFGKAVFTVDANLIANHAGNKTAEAYWFWPELLPGSDKRDPKHNYSTVVKLRASFYGYGRDRDTYTTWQNSLKLTEAYKPEVVQSDIEGLKKIKAGTSNFVYMPQDDRMKSPQGTPLLFWCFPEKLPPQLTCEMVFHYYDQVSVHVEFNGDTVLPHWQDFSSRINNFFTSRMQEK